MDDIQRKNTEKIFKFYEPGALCNQKRISYYGWESKNIIFAYHNYFKGYKEAAESTYNGFLEAAKLNRIDIQDTIGFPLIFLYRHMLEICLKYFYLKYSDDTLEGKIGYIKDANHNLAKSWAAVKSILTNKYPKDKINFFSRLMDSYVKEFDEFDTDSFNMRYPTNKKLEPCHNEGKRVDIIYFKEKMDLLYEIINDLDQNLSEN